MRIFGGLVHALRTEFCEWSGKFQPKSPIMRRFRGFPWSRKTAMIAPFWTLPVRNRRDLLAARRHARSIARLLSFDEQDQICIAAATYLATSQAFAAWRRHEVGFAIEGGQLHVVPAHPKRLEELAPWCVRKPLPGQVSLPSPEDLGWLAKQICGAACENPFDEIARQNDEILRLLIALREKSYPISLPAVRKSPTAA